MLAHWRRALAFTARDFTVVEGEIRWYPEPLAVWREDVCLRGQTPLQVAALPGHHCPSRREWCVMVGGLPHACYNDLATCLSQVVPVWLAFHVLARDSHLGILRFRFRDDALQAMRALQGGLGLRGVWAPMPLPDVPVPRGGLTWLLPSAPGARRRAAQEAPDSLAQPDAPPGCPCRRPSWHSAGRAPCCRELFLSYDTDRLPAGDRRVQLDYPPHKGGRVYDLDGLAPCARRLRG